MIHLTEIAAGVAALVVDVYLVVAQVWRLPLPDGLKMDGRRAKDGLERDRSRLLGDMVRAVRDEVRDDQRWFWQDGEHEADEDIAAGRTTVFESEEFLRSLDRGRGTGCAGWVEQ